MDLYELINILDDTDLTREIVDLKSADGQGISWSNYTTETLSATVNDEEYNELLKVCLVPKGDVVRVYINNITRFKVTGIDLEDVLSFSIS